MPVKILLPWKRQINWTKGCHTELFLGKVAKFGGICFNIKKVINLQSQLGNFLPPPPHPPWLNRVKGIVEPPMILLPQH